jgi:hypothetical protein
MLGFKKKTQPTSPFAARDQHDEKESHKTFFFSLTWVFGQLARTSTNPTGPEVNDHISLQWPSYKQPQGSNLRSQREQTSWSQTFTTGPPPRWLNHIKLCICRLIVFHWNLISWVYVFFLTWMCGSVCA